MKKRFMEYRKNAIKMQKKAESENKYQKKQKDEPRSLTDIKSVRTTDSSLPNSITIDDENSSKNIKNRIKKTDGSSEVSIQSTPTQTNPTFSRTDLGAVLYNRITINEINARYILYIILLDIKFRIINNLFVFIQLILCAKLSLLQTTNIK